MAEERLDSMNLDLNLGPGPEPLSRSTPNTSPLNFDRFRGEFRDAIELRARQRWRWRHSRDSPETRNVSMELNQFMSNANNPSSVHAGEGSVPAEERTDIVLKTFDSNNENPDGKISDKKGEGLEKNSKNGNNGNFFDCNICFNLAKDPVVTSCGHLFCWPCLYRLNNIHSDSRQCPVCKVEVTVKTVTPVYGRGNNTVRESEEDDESDKKIPLRPQARRIESLRQRILRTSHSFPVDEMFRQLRNSIGLNRELVQQEEPESESSSLSFERARTLLNRILTSSRMQGEDVVDLTQGEEDVSGAEAGEYWTHPIVRRAQLRRSIASALPLSLTLNSPERVVVVDDRDSSFSSIAAVINSESHMDTAMEIDSMVSLSTSSSIRMNNDTSRISDVDTGDSRAPRRRRLN